MRKVQSGDGRIDDDLANYVTNRGTKTHYTALVLPFCFLDTGEPSPPSAVVASSKAVSSALPFAVRVRFPVTRATFAGVEGLGLGSPVIGNAGTGSKLNGTGLPLRVISDELTKGQRRKTKQGDGGLTFVGLKPLAFPLSFCVQYDQQRNRLERH